MFSYLISNGKTMSCTPGVAGCKTRNSSPPKGAKDIKSFLHKKKAGSMKTVTRFDIE